MPSSSDPDNDFGPDYALANLDDVHLIIKDLKEKPFKGFHTQLEDLKGNFIFQVNFWINT